ncbi:ArsR/SmtB family transcription factor [Streptomyces tropicalis]|uniref:DUF5937 family protein n=1 Tax=Streptomyces tropicalis TaxID=3034234 RepID=A0ABT6A4R2_9ACTN|nr:DUF5937 family protein [Streptomyces tropicalis]MDF3299448.1 DUF5937 family protein [Streptomyces tropicalis]
MSSLHFDVGDVAKIRFTISPLWDTVSSFWVLADAGRNSVHRPWITSAKELLKDRDLARTTAPLRSLTGRSICLPDFLTPPPDCSTGDIEDELAIVLATPHARVQAEVEAMGDSAVPGSFSHRLATDAQRALPQLVQAVEAWWQAALRPHWPRMRAVLEADVAFRTRELSRGGVQTLFHQLHPALHWTGDRLGVDDMLDTDIRLNGRGLPLVPSLFATRSVLVASSAASPPIAVYPARALGTLWEQGGTEYRSVARLLGRSRAMILAFTTSPCTTTQLAARTGLSAPAVSQHLGVLREAGLVTKSRYRNEVNYVVSELGSALLDQSAGHAALRRP